MWKIRIIRTRNVMVSRAFAEPARYIAASLVHGKQIGMFKYAATLAIFAVGCFVASNVAVAHDVAVAAYRVHTLSLQVSVEGSEVMAPVFAMNSAAPARLSIGTGAEDDYTLVVGIVENVVPWDSDVVVAHFVLWQGQADHGVRLLDDVILLGGAQQQRVGERGLGSMGSGAAMVTVVSYASQLKPRYGKAVDPVRSGTGGALGDTASLQRAAPLALRSSTPGRW